MVWLAGASVMFAVLAFGAVGVAAAIMLGRGRRLARAESHAVEAKHWLELAEKIAHIGHWRYNTASRKLLWSDEIYQIYGVSKADFTVTLESALAPYVPEDLPLIARIFRDAQKYPAPFECTARLLRADGVLRHVMARGVAQRDETGKITAIFGVFADITDQKRIEQELKDAHAMSEIANRALHEMAMQDGLTGLPNRRHFDGALAQEFKRAARDHLELSLIMIDLDYFKGFNDLYGHPAGDACLRKVAEAIAGVPQRPADLVARYGGEEMVVLLPNTDAPGAAMVAGLLRDAVRELKIPHAASPALFVTVSCGVASFIPELDPHVPVMLVERADRALYQAKLAGRNRVACHGGVNSSH
jgi:diguanylate cyclase (GGDEF)-like protein/PAS domain S-box-containing protein